MIDGVTKFMRGLGDMGQPAPGIGPHAIVTEKELTARIQHALRAAPAGSQTERHLKLALAYMGEKRT